MTDHGTSKEMYLYTFPEGEVHKRKVTLFNDGWALLPEGEGFFIEDFGDYILKDEDAPEETVYKEFISLLGN